jgi:hypothetical protein
MQCRPGRVINTWVFEEVKHHKDSIGQQENCCDTLNKPIIDAAFIKVSFIYHIQIPNRTVKIRLPVKTTKALK